MAFGDFVFYFLLGFVFFVSLFLLVNGFCYRYFRKQLSHHDIAIISERGVSSIQSVVSCIVGLIIISSCKDILYDQHWLTNAYTCFGLPYFVYDSWAMYNSHYYLYEGKIKSLSLSNKLHHFLVHTKLLLVHHVLLPLIFFPIVMFLRNGLGDFFIGVLYTIEVTIPLISARQIMVQLKLKNHPSYIIVGLSMIAVFFISRILVFPYLYWSYAVYAKMALWEVFRSIPIKCNLGCLVIFLPQVYWLIMMVKGALKYFTKPRNKSGGLPNSKIS